MRTTRIALGSNALSAAVLVTDGDRVLLLDPDVEGVKDPVCDGVVVTLDVRAGVALAERPAECVVVGDGDRLAVIEGEGVAAKRGANATPRILPPLAKDTTILVRTRARVV